MIYFIRCGDYIKIGMSVDPWGRLASLQTANPQPLEMLAISPGGGELESGLHVAFEDDRINGEWFRAAIKLLEYIDSVKRTFPRMQGKPEQQQVDVLPSPDYQEAHSRSTWIEFPSSGTVNPKRYAMRRAWMHDNGGWKKVTLGRAEEFPPLTEAQYRHYKETGQLPEGVSIEA